MILLIPKLSNYPHGMVRCADGHHSRDLEPSPRPVRLPPMYGSARATEARGRASDAALQQPDLMA
jgi:hypothetical protein